MLLNKQERKYKRFVAVQRELNDIRKAMCELPWTEVKPYQDGWHIYMDFRDDIKRRADYPPLRRALDLVSRVGTTRNPKIVRGIRGNRRPEAVYALYNPKGYYGRTEHHREGDIFDKPFNHYPTGYYRMGYPPVLGRLTIANWEKESPDVQRWFYKVTDDTKYWGPKEWYQAHFPTYWMVVKTRPLIVTHTRDINPELLQREAELEKEQIELGRDFWDNYGRTWGKRFGNKALRMTTRAALSKVLKGEIEDFEIKKKIRNYD